MEKARLNKDRKELTRDYNRLSHLGTFGCIQHEADKMSYMTGFPAESVRGTQFPLGA